MANNKAISNEEIIAALLQHGTIKEAGAALKISPRTIYDRMKDRDFARDYTAAKNNIVSNAVVYINRNLSQAIDEVADIMTDKDVNPAVRLQAAQTIINSASKFTTVMSANDETFLKQLPISLGGFFS